ncbi:MAG: alpha-2-macroglobulin family protein [Deltaproteobacteria bacterium]
MRTRLALGLGALALLAAVGAQLSIARPTTDNGPVVVPEKFLRRWDPVTVFFPGAVGRSGPEDRPERFVRIEPSHPGAYTWIDAKTLQFVPAEPWPALERVRVRPESGRSVGLVTLINPPSRTLPRPGADNLQPLDAITLTFGEPIPLEALAKMTTIELRPRPGLDASRAHWLDEQDFVVKMMERRSPSDAATYVLQLREPIPESTRATVHFALSLDDDHEDSAHSFSFSTLDAFRLLSFGCGGTRLPVTPAGSQYEAEEALRCQGGGRRVHLELSSEPSAIDEVLLNNFVRFTPPVEGVKVVRSGRTLMIEGRFEVEKRYELAVHPTPLTDTAGRRLDLHGTSRMSFYYPRYNPFLSLQDSSGTVERLGPQTIPIGSRGHDRVDLRIHRVDPLDRRFWPFPRQVVAVDESKRPPGPGEEIELDVNARFTPTTSSVRELLRTMGTGDLSRIVRLPIGRDDNAATYGLDLSEHLASIAGAKRPGTYLVGVRHITGAPQRAWMRLQVTDLAVSIAEEPHEARFFVTSLASGKPVAGARVLVEGRKNKSWHTFFAGKTDGAGSARWSAPGYIRNAEIRRVVVQLGEDRLVIDPNDPPQRFAHNRWTNNRSGALLSWMIASHPERRGDQAKTLCHVFSERPVYRPDEAVHLKGFVRTRHEGELSLPKNRDYSLVVRGAGDLKYTYPIELSKSGSFYVKFAQENLPTGMLTASFGTPTQPRMCQVSFSMEAYRIPKFEVRLHGEDVTPLDGSFTLKGTASYYAGGPVAGRPIRWRVTQFPYAWNPPSKLKGFVYSTDSRYSIHRRFESTPNLGRNDSTDETGAAKLELNPALEPTAQPRTYVVEATVTGADDQTVSATKQVRAVPPFVVGVNVPRFIERAKSIRPQVVAVDPKGKLVAGQPLTVKLIHRTWHSHLMASDFSDGVAKYITDVVDTPVMEKKLKSRTAPQAIDLPIETGGVYVVEVAGRDRLGRAQVVSVDLYVGGDQTVTWQKPEDDTFEVATDKATYEPGDKATFLLKSPFANGRALVVVEGPDRNRYEWIDVKAGAATYRHVVKKNEVPRLPVHFVLMRGRAGAPPKQSSLEDKLKPWTLASTKWIEVRPVEHQVKVELDHPARAQPGEKVKMKIRVTDRKGRGQPAEVTLWLVDQAVLALGKEQKLDPLGAFITRAETYLSIADTRNAVFGRRTYAENPGGDGAEADEEMRAADSLLDKVTVRKNFKTVPVYLPAVQVPKSGVVTVDIPLPDNLTNFKIRAKAVSGADRFGVAKSTISVRLPVLVQPSLPRFVRAADRFDGGGIARVVEGEGGAGRVELAAENVKIEGAKKRAVTLVKNRPTPVLFSMEAASPDFAAKGDPSVKLTLAVNRNADNARDAFAVQIPLRPDRSEERERILEIIEPGKKRDIPGLTAPARPGTAQRTVLVSTEPALVHMASSLNALERYPHGNAEAQISRARALVATQKFVELLHIDRDLSITRRGVLETLAFVERCTTGGGLVGQWPGSTGYVWLTADALELMVEARAAGFVVNQQLMSRYVSSLQRALRSDYPSFVNGAAWSERVMSLAALARAKRFDAAYAAELSNKSQFLGLESVAGVAQAFMLSGQQHQPTIESLNKTMWDGVIVRRHQGKEIYGGLQDRHGAGPSLILPSETRTLAEITRAQAMIDRDGAKLPVLVAALTTLGRGDGWGSTNADAAALLALSEVLKANDGAPSHRVDIQSGRTKKTVRIGGAQPVEHFATDRVEAMTIVNRGSTPILVRVETRHVPAKSGSSVDTKSKGFVTTRRHLLVREGGPAEKRPIAEANQTLELRIGDVVEEHVQVVNPKDRAYVAVRVPLAAGLEPMNPNLATAPAEAKPSTANTLAPTYLAFMDDHVTYYFDTLAKGTYDFYFRTRASTTGTFTQPPAETSMMYDGTVFGRSPGARVVVKAKE